MLESRLQFEKESREGRVQDEYSSVVKNYYFQEGLLQLPWIDFESLRLNCPVPASGVRCG